MPASEAKPLDWNGKEESQNRHQSDACWWVVFLGEGAWGMATPNHLCILVNGL